MSRSSIDVKKGDVITPLLLGIFLNKDFQMEIRQVDSTKTITVDNYLTIRDTPLKNGNYGYIFQFIDSLGTALSSRTFFIELDDGEIYAEVSEAPDFTPEISVNPEGNVVVNLPEGAEEELRKEIATLDEKRQTLRTLERLREEFLKLLQENEAFLAEEKDPQERRNLEAQHEEVLNEIKECDKDIAELKKRIQEIETLQKMLEEKENK